MALKNMTKTNKIPANSETLTKAVNESLDTIATDETPYMKQDTTGEISVIGDAKKVVEEVNTRVYDLGFILPLDKFNPKDFNEDMIVRVGDVNFIVKTTATQEKVSPFNRLYFVSVGAQFVASFFVPLFDDNGEATGQYGLRDGDDRVSHIKKFYRSDVAVEDAKFYVGKMLGVDEELIPYMADSDLVEYLIDLILKNPSLMNESFYSAKQ